MTNINETLDSAIEHLHAERIEQAQDLFQKVLQNQPNHPVALHSLGIIAYRRQTRDLAVELISKAIENAPRTPQFHNSLGVVFNALERFDDAIVSFNKALNLAPDYHEPCYNMANSLQRLNKFTQAIERYNHALLLEPDDPNIYYNIAVTMQKLDRHTEAVEHFEKALDLNLNLAEVHKTMAVSLQIIGRQDESIDSFRRALRLKPDYAQAHSDLGMVLLQTGNFTKGFRHYRWRLHDESWGKYYHGLPRWDGSDFAGKTLLVRVEQGLGDNIQFIRYLPMVKERGGTVILGGYKQLYSLLKDFPGIDKIVVGNQSATFDLYTLLLDLPGIFGTTLENIIQNVPYIYPDPPKVRYWQNKLAGPDFKVGIVWAGSPSYGHDHNRSCKFKYFAPLMKIPGVQVYGLQKGLAAKQSSQLSDKISITNLGDEFHNFSDTAAAIENLDLVISVDTAVLHLAGAMAKPTWAILGYPSDWRWLLNRSDSPWYPTMRLFRQKKQNQWDDVFADVTQKLRILVKKHTMTMPFLAEAQL